MHCQPLEDHCFKHVFLTNKELTVLVSAVVMADFRGESDAIPRHPCTLWVIGLVGATIYNA